MDIRSVIRTEKLSGKENCVICEKDLFPEDRVLAAEHRIGGKVIGKTIKVKSCLECAETLKDTLQSRIREAKSL